MRKDINHGRKRDTDVGFKKDGDSVNYKDTHI